MFWPYWGVNCSYIGRLFVNAGLSDRRTPWINGGDGSLAWFCQTNVDFDTRCWFSQQTATLEAPEELPNTKVGAKPEWYHAVKHLRETTAIHLHPASVTFDLQSSSSRSNQSASFNLSTQSGDKWAENGKRVTSASVKCHSGQVTSSPGRLALGCHGYFFVVHLLKCV